jgi:DNA invertase Pin-like site-specific DNA recombinase
MLYATSTLPASQELRVVPVAIYTRVSTDGQTGHRFDSCEHQANVCRDFIGNNCAAGWFEFSHFSDEAYSGATLDRPGIRRLMQCIAAGQVRVLLIYRLERILRSISEWTRLQDFLDVHGCRLLSPTEDHSDASASGRLKTNMMMSFAEYERSNVAEKTRSKLHAQARRGLWGGGYIPYGYGYDRERQRLTTNPAEAATLRRIFTCASELVPLGQIATELARDNILSGVRWAKGEHRERKSVGGKPFRTDILRKLIQNPLYRGVIRHGGKEYAGQHQALVNADIWEQANAAITEAKRKPKRPLRGRDKNSNLLKGILVCAVCRQPLFAKASGNNADDGPRYRYYLCKGPPRDTAPEQTCHLGNMPAKPLEELVVTFLGCIGRHNSTVDRVSDLPRILQSKQGQLSGNLASVEQNLQAIKTKIRNCTEVLAQGGIEILRPELAEQATQLSRQRQPLLVRREEIRQQLHTLNDQRFDVARLQHAFERLGRVLVTISRTELRALLVTLLERIDIQEIERSNRFKILLSGDRLFRLSFWIRTEAVVSAMERGTVIDDTTPMKHSQTVELEAGVLVGRNRRTKIITPFRIDLDGPALIAPPAQESPQHPICRATRWSKEIATGTGVRAFARTEGVSPSLVSLHVKLLRLAPEIQGFLRDLTSPKALQHFSLRKLAALAELSHERQLVEFASLRSQFN